MPVIVFRDVGVVVPMYPADGFQLQLFEILPSCKCRVLDQLGLVATDYMSRPKHCRGHRRPSPSKAIYREGQAAL